jgi:hypothetical protein
VARMRLWHLQTTRGLGGAQGRARSCAQLPATKSLFLGNQEKDFFSQKFCFMGGAKRDAGEVVSVSCLPLFCTGPSRPDRSPSNGVSSQCACPGVPHGWMCCS